MAPKTQPTLRAIAARARVAGSTVSRALRHHPSIPPETCAKVFAAARQLGYVGNPLASSVMSHIRRGAVSGCRGKIAWLSNPHPADIDRIPWVRDIHQGARARAAQAGFLFEDIWLKDPTLSADRLTAVLQARGVQGVIVPNDHPYLTGLQWDFFACATTLASAIAPPIHRAGHDPIFGIRESWVQLRRRGYDRIGLMLHPLQDYHSQGLERAAFLLERAALPARLRVPILMLPEHGAEPENIACFDRWIQRHQPEAVLCINEYVIAWALALGLPVPGRLGLVHLVRHSHLKQWAGIDLREDQIGAAVVDLVTGQLLHGEHGLPRFPKTVLIKSEWVDGPTVRPLPVARVDLSLKG
jgi:LacI family transcriptional regulator